MNLDLTGKRALVTGSSAGIGYAIALELARLGATVYVNARSVGRVASALASIRQEHPAAQLVGVAADLATRAGADAIFAAIPALDVLVNNVGGVNAFKSFEDLSDADWQQAFDINVMSGVRLTRHYLPGMRERDWGRVVFIASESGVQIPAEFIQYGAVKAAVIALARGIAETLIHCGVTVNSVLPGPTLAEGLGRAISRSGQTPAEFEQQMFATRRQTSLLRRFATPQEVASMVTYLCSPAASATHGAALRVDGGVIKSAF